MWGTIIFPTIPIENHTVKKTCTVPSLRITIGFDMSTVLIAMIVEKMPNLKSGIWSTRSLQFLSINDLHRVKYVHLLQRGRSWCKTRVHGNLELQ